MTRRRRLASHLGDLEHLLLGSLVKQVRRCGRPNCRCASGEPHGPYTYFAPRRGGGGLKYVSGAMASSVLAYLRHGDHVEALLAEISEINVELLARRALPTNAGLSVAD
jgi:Family of unknown function (DUF6788)